MRLAAVFERPVGQIVRYESESLEAALFHNQSLVLIFGYPKRKNISETPM
jgi:hypothetical protein